MLSVSMEFPAYGGVSSCHLLFLNNTVIHSRETKPSEM